MEMNCDATPGVAIVKIFPERITWDGKVPNFTPDLIEDEEHRQMVLVMEKLLTANGFVRHEDSLFFIRDYASCN